MSAAPVLARNGKPIVSECVHGHSLTDTTNVYIRSNGSRVCIACRDARRKAMTPVRQTVSDMPYVDGEALIDILAAIVKLAISDYLYHHDDRPHMAARDFLVSCGIVDPVTGVLDSHGHVIPGKRPYSRKEPA
jgi:hypothetical protein